MLFRLRANMLAGLAICFLPGVYSDPCPTGTVAVNGTSAADIRTLTDAMNCTGQGYFDVTWYTSLTLGQNINVRSLKNVTITGFPFPAFHGGPGDDYDGHAGIDAVGGTGIFSVSDRSTLSLNNLVLAGGRAENGGAVELFSFSSLFVYGCNFENNIASNGGAVFASSSSVVIDGTTTFLNNSSLYGGAIYSNASRVHIDGDSYFGHNSADSGGAIIAISSNIYMDGSTLFEHNRAGIVGGAMYAISSEIYMEDNTSFINNWAGVDGGSMDVRDSEVYMEGNSSFFNNSAGSDGGAMDVAFSAVYMAGNTSFVNNWAASRGGYMEAVLSHIYMKSNTSFVNNWATFGGAMIVWSSEVYMEGNISFVDNWADAAGGAVYALNSSILTSGRMIQTGDLAETEGDAYHDVDTETAILPKIKFIGNAALGLGGAMHVNSFHELELGGVEFQSNEAKLGGAIYVASTEAKFTEYNACVFEGNKASEGGAIYLATGSGVDRFTASVFRDNYAEFSGGAIFHTGSLHVVDTNFVANKAGVEGPAIISIGFINELSNVSFSQNSFHCRAEKYGYIIDNKAFTDASVLATRAIDYSSIVCDVNDLAAESRQSVFSKSSFDEVCARCSTGHLGDTEFEDVRVSGAPVCEDPPVGTITESRGNTVETLRLEKGYYRSSNQSHSILVCYQPKACIGGNDAAKYCASGYNGPYCAVCVEGYTPGIAYSCHKCSGDIKRSAVGRMIAVGLAALLVGALLFAHLGCVVRDAANQDTGAARISWAQKWWSFQRFVVTIVPLLAIKIVVTVWQIISQFGAIAGNVYPKVYTAFVSKLTPINLDFDVVLSYSCIITTDFYDHLLLATIAPALVLMTFAGSYLVAKTRNSKAGYATCTVLHKHQAAALYLAFFIYSPVSYKIFQTFACDRLDDGNSYLRADYSLSCFTPRHRWYKAYALVMIGVYPVGIATVLAYLLARYRHDLVKPHRHSILRLKPFRGLWAAYKPSRYYYEVVECVRRSTLTVIAAFVPSNSTAQVSMVLLIAATFVFISEAISPFEKKADMNIYRWGNAIIVASMYVAFLTKFDVGYDTDHALLTFSVVLILANVFMVVTVLLQTDVFGERNAGGETRGTRA